MEKKIEFATLGINAVVMDSFEKTGEKKVLEVRGELATYGGWEKYKLSDKWMLIDKDAMTIYIEFDRVKE